MFSLYHYMSKDMLFNSICRAIDDETFVRKGLKSTEITTSMSHILPPGILISCLSTRTKFVCFKKNLRDSLNSWKEITVNVPGKYEIIFQFPCYYLILKIFLPIFPYLYNYKSR